MNIMYYKKLFLQLRVWNSDRVENRGVSWRLRGRDSFKTQTSTAPLLFFLLPCLNC